MKSKKTPTKTPGDFSRVVDLINNGGLKEAEVLCKKLLQNPHHSFDAHQLLATIYLHQERFIEAFTSSEEAIKIDNSQPAVWSNRSLALMGLNDLSNALLSVNQALELKPDFADAIFNKSNILSKMDRFNESLTQIKRYLRQNPSNYLGWAFRAKIHSQLKQYDEAINAYKEAFNLNPLSLEVLINLSLVLGEAGLYEEAELYLKKAISLNPNIYIAHLNLGVVYDKMGKFEKAKECILNAKKLNPQAPDVLLNLGIVCQKFDNGLEESLEYFNTLVGQDDKNAAYFFNRGVTLERLTRLPEAIADYESAIQFSDPISSIQPRWNRALSLLCNGDLQRGWKEYEIRFELDQMENRSFHKANFNKRWNGDKNLIKGKRLLVIAEQGLGDTLQFSRYVRFLVEAQVDVTLMIQKPLIGLFQSFQYPVRLLDTTQSPPMFDYYCSLMSLPYLLQAQVTGVPGDIFYLKAEPEKTNKWASRLGDSKCKRVGLVWSGGFRPDPALWLVNRRRNIELSKLESLKMEGIEFHSLQIGELPESELLVKYLQNWDGPEIKNHAEYLKDFTETAALLENLDLLISVDTSTPHLAGVLGKPVWLLNRFDTCWRWMLKSSTTPWYPSFRIFRQKTPGDWDSVVDELREALKEFAKSK